MDGILIVDKPAGMTSHDVVARVRKIIKTKRVGHTGTLDPFATGVLAICVNRATRLVQFLMGDEKEYIATMRLGYGTDTGDFTGSRLPATGDASHFSDEIVMAAMAQFRGPVRQTPPMYSAKKVGGVKLYKMARRGEEIARAPIEIEIKELELLESGEERETATRDFRFRVICSSGAYIRTLAEDIGKQLGAGAHLTALRRTRAGIFRIQESTTLEALAECFAEGETKMISMSAAAPFPALQLDQNECKAVSHGRSIRRHGYWQEGTRAKLLGESGELIAIANFDAEKLVWQPIVVLAH